MISTYHQQIIDQRFQTSLVWYFKTLSEITKHFWPEISKILLVGDFKNYWSERSKHYWSDISKRLLVIYFKTFLIGYLKNIIYRRFQKTLFIRDFKKQYWSDISKVEAFVPSPSVYEKFLYLLIVSGAMICYCTAPIWQKYISWLYFQTIF